MSSGSEDSMDDFIVSDSGSDFDDGPKGHKVASVAHKVKSKAPAAADGPAKKVIVKKAVASQIIKKKPAVLAERDENRSESEPDASAPVRVRKPTIIEEDESDGDTIVSGAKPKAKKSASEMYQKLDQLEHILKRPDSYIGSIEPITQPMWVYDAETKAMIHRNTTFVPGLYKIFDEILVNAADNKINDATMNQFKVTIDPEEGSISVFNNGRGIPIEIHKKEGIWIPELIFGHLLTSSNYDDDERKVTGGRNGYGAKLANIYSTEFIVETADATTGQVYKQVFSNNMRKKTTPKISEKSDKRGKEWTQITFKPDFTRFSMPDGMDSDTISLFTKRVYDMAGTVNGCKVFLNGKQIHVRDFKSYVGLYTNAAAAVAATAGPALVGASPTGASATKSTIIYEKFGSRWEVAFALSDGQFNQVSFVNSIATTKGGTHVEHVSKQLIDGIIEVVKKKNKAAPIKNHQVKQHLWLFVNCLIENPAFDSQTKENMTLAAGKFGSKCKITEDFIKKVTKSGVVDNVLNFAKYKQDQMMKKTDGSKRSRITGLAKLEDANNAGTKNAKNCTLILTEGDSAKALAVSGLSVVGRDNWGVFPLRGKLLNVRDAAGKSLLENAEIQAIKQIMGLQHQKVYTSAEQLRYGHLMIMTDQDHDGSHIKGLIINFLDHFYPSLLKIPNFLVEFITPIVRVSKAKKELSFFTIPQYEEWKQENNDGRGWNIKYYKGLGTSTAADAKKYFSAMENHRLSFRPLNEEDRMLIDMAFNKKKADDRKDWLRGYQSGTFLDHNVAQIPIADFINKELILFSMADNVRSIPSVIDGLKPGQRKVLFGCFKRKLKKEIKVAQLAGYVSEHSAYHHGEQSLTMTIVNLAQDFVGSNNVNLLDPNGQFGTRLQGGKDAASPRYIFTNVPAITRTLFHPADDNLLSYLNDDGQSIEPEWYMPILPMVLVNGSDGIGTGWSSYLPNFNPEDIVANLKRKMAHEDVVPMQPWWRGFTGTIESLGGGKYKSIGTWHYEDDTLDITELPIRSWTQSYKEQLEAWVQGTDKNPALVKDYKEHHSDTTVAFSIALTAEGKKAIARDGVEKAFKLSWLFSTGNMVCFDLNGKIKKYNTAEEILEEFYDERLSYYAKRKVYLVNELRLVFEKLSNQARFIQMIINKEIIINNRKRSAIVVDLRSHDFRPFPKVAKASVAADADDNGSDLEEEIDDLDAAGSDSDFDYLLNMPLRSLTREKIERLLAERDEHEQELNALLGLTQEALWRRDLDAFLEQWRLVLENDVKSRHKVVRKGKTVAKKKAAYSDDEDDVDEGDLSFRPVKKTAPKGPTGKAGMMKKAPPSALASSPAIDRLALSSQALAAKAGSKRPSPPPKAKPAKKPKVYELSESEDDDDVFLKTSKPKASGSRATSASQTSASRRPSPALLEVSETESDVGPRPKRARAAMPVTYEVSDEDDEDASDGFQQDSVDEEDPSAYMDEDDDDD